MVKIEDTFQSKNLNLRPLHLFLLFPNLHALFRPSLTFTWSLSNISCEDHLRVSGRVVFYNKSQHGAAGGCVRSRIIGSFHSHCSLIRPLQGVTAILGRRVPQADCELRIIHSNRSVILIDFCNSLPPCSNFPYKKTFTVDFIHSNFSGIKK